MRSGKETKTKWYNLKRLVKQELPLGVYDDRDGSNSYIYILYANARPVVCVELYTRINLPEYGSYIYLYIFIRQPLKSINNKSRYVLARNSKRLRSHRIARLGCSTTY